MQISLVTSLNVFFGVFVYFYFSRFSMRIRRKTRTSTPHNRRNVSVRFPFSQGRPFVLSNGRNNMYTTRIKPIIQVDRLNRYANVPSYAFSLFQSQVVHLDVLKARIRYFKRRAGTESISSCIYVSGPSFFRKKKRLSVTMVKMGDAGLRGRMYGCRRCRHRGRT